LPIGKLPALHGVSLDRLKECIVETQSVPLVPLLLFYGGYMRPARARSYLNIVLAMMTAEARGIPVMITDTHHLCGYHGRYIQHSVVKTFLSRLWMSPEVTDQIPHLREYLGEYPFEPEGLKRVAPVGDRMRSAPWRQPILAKRGSPEWRRNISLAKRGHKITHQVKASEIPSFYPFIVGEPQKEHDLIMAVDGIVPKGLPQSIREDLCQDLLVDIISGETTLENLRENIRFRVRHAFKIHGWKYGVLSLDQPAYAGSSTTIGELLSA
jgi:hypothetical protein